MAARFWEKIKLTSRETAALLVCITVLALAFLWRGYRPEAAPSQPIAGASDTAITEQRDSVIPHPRRKRRSKKPPKPPKPVPQPRDIFAAEEQIN